jgi:hypothetical protein
MTQKSIAATLGIAVAIGVGSLGTPALALPAPVYPEAGNLRNAAWACGPRRCAWVPGYRGPIPGFASAWGPPIDPRCYWKRGLLGRWKFKCDR